MNLFAISCGGFLYKFILAHVLGETLLPPLKNLALQSGGFFNLYTLAVMYTFGWSFSLILQVTLCLPWLSQT